MVLITWNAPPTAVYGAAIPSNWWNTYIRDNLNETAPGKATGTTSAAHFAPNGVNSIAQRLILRGDVDDSQTTTSTTYDDLSTPGGSCSPTTGSFALIWNTATLENSTTGQTARCSFEVNQGGVTVGTAGDYAGCIMGQNAGGYGLRATGTDLRSVTPGVNQFKQRYRVSGGTGTFSGRRIMAMAL